MNEKLCFHCKKPIKWMVSDEGNYFWACDCAKKRFIYTLDMPFQWRSHNYKKIIKQRGEQIPKNIKIRSKTIR